jgi:hypothetical protein
MIKKYISKNEDGIEVCKRYEIFCDTCKMRLKADGDKVIKFKKYPVKYFNVKIEYANGKTDNLVLCHTCFNNFIDDFIHECKKGDKLNIVYSDNAQLYLCGNIEYDYTTD